MKRALATMVAALVLVVSMDARADDAALRTTSPDSPPAGRPEMTYFGLLSGGAAYRTLFGSPLETGVVSLAFGGETRDLAIYARGDFEEGSTAYGLRIRAIRIGVSVEGIFDRFRIGVGANGSVVSFYRVASDATSVDRLGVGLFGITSVDVVRWDARALYLGARLDADVSASMYGGSLVLGFRL